MTMGHAWEDPSELPTTFCTACGISYEEWSEGRSCTPSTPPSPADEPQDRLDIMIPLQASVGDSSRSYRKPFQEVGDSPV
ncbi:hypothetical protein GCM10010517_55550 [Streptosporangium fragile]|uniref:Uncharacterized protein n=1 Tax=Streptosporangium fragile TaxID=46186 RepID=A0ABN3W444_9ACTN